MLRGAYESLSMAKNYNLENELLNFFGSSRPWLEVC